MLTGFSAKDKEVLEEAGQVRNKKLKKNECIKFFYANLQISNQAISNIRTVAILNKEDYFSQQYSEKIYIPYKYKLNAKEEFMQL